MLKDIKKLGPQSTKNYYKYRLPEFSERETFINQKNQIKNQHYYADTTNVWNNYSRLSEKNKVFLYLEKNDKIHEELQQKKIQIQQEKTDQVAVRVQSAKNVTKTRFQERQYKQAALQKESEQILDDKQYQLLEKDDPQDYFQVRKQLWHHNKDAKINTKQPENGWNMLKNTSNKNVKTVFTETVVKNEEKGIKLAKQKIKEERELENKIKQEFNNKKNKTRQDFLRQHKNNLEFEQKLKIGVFGEYKKNEQGKYEVQQKIPDTINKPFPTKYDVVVQRTHLNKIPSDGREEFFQRLAEPKKKFQPENTLEYSDFRGLFLADCDKKTVIQENDIIQAYKDTFVYQNIKNQLQRPTTGGYRNNQVTIRRPQSCKPMKGVEYKNYEKSINFLNEKDKTEQNQVISELDEFDKNIKQNKDQIKKGFSKVSQIEYEHLSTTKGFFKVKQLKQKQNYPQCYSGNYNPEQSIKRNNFVQTKNKDSNKTQLEIREITKESINQTFDNNNSNVNNNNEQQKQQQNIDYDKTFSNQNNNSIQQEEIKVNDEQQEQDEQLQKQQQEEIQELSSQNKPGSSQDYYNLIKNDDSQKQSIEN